MQCKQNFGWGGFEKMYLEAYSMHRSIVDEINMHIFTTRDDCAGFYEYRWHILIT